MVSLPGMYLSFQCTRRSLKHKVLSAPVKERSGIRQLGVKCVEKSSTRNTTEHWGQHCKKCAWLFSLLSDFTIVISPWTMEATGANIIVKSIQYQLSPLSYTAIWSDNMIPETETAICRTPLSEILGIEAVDLGRDSTTFRR